VIRIRTLFSVFVLAILLAFTLSGCVAGGSFVPQFRPVEAPLTASDALGLYDAARDASLRLVISGLERHHLEGGSAGEASAFLDQARSLFEAEGRFGASVDVWGFGLRAGIDRAEGADERADRLLEKAMSLSPEIWGDGRLSASELR
jgi:hypothetical protein